MSVFHYKFYSEKTRNAFSFEASVDLLKAAKLAVKNKQKVFIFSNEGDYFCSGGDLQSLLKLKTRKAGQDLNSKIEKNLEAFSKLPIYKIALVGGDCFGGGTELLSCFDLRLAVSHACFGFFQKRFHLTTGWGGFARWSAKGVQVESLLATGQILSAYHALRMGLIHEVYSSEESAFLLDRVLKSLDLQSDFLQQLVSIKSKPANEKKAFNSLWWSKDHLAALAKFKKYAK